MIRSCTFCVSIKGGVRYYGVVLDDAIEGFQEWDVIEVTDASKHWKLWASRYNHEHHPQTPDVIAVMETKVVESTNSFDPPLKHQVNSDRQLFKRR